MGSVLREDRQLSSDQWRWINEFVCDAGGEFFECRISRDAIGVISSVDDIVEARIRRVDDGIAWKAHPIAFPKLAQQGGGGLELSLVDLLATMFRMRATRLLRKHRSADEPDRNPSGDLPRQPYMRPIVRARKQDGLVLSMSVGENASLASLDRAERFGLLSRQAERENVQPFVDRFRVKSPSLRERVSNLSGGNQQKVILAKWLATGPTILMLDEPTRGIDVQAKNEIYTLINELTAEGLSVVVVSSELPEVMAVSDRILVLCEGSATMEFDREDATEEAIMHAGLPGRTVTAC